MAAHADGSSKDVTTAATWRVLNVPPLLQPSELVLQFVSPGTAQAWTRGEANVQAVSGNVQSPTLLVRVLEPGTFKVSGRVTEAGGAPLRGKVEIASGTGAGLSTVSDSNIGGQYALVGAAGDVEVRTSADGFEQQVRRVVVTADANADFSLSPLVTPADVSGSWTVTLSASVSCRDALPELARERTFTAAITQQSTTFRIGLSSPTSKNLCPLDFGRILGGALSFVILGEDAASDGSFVVPCMVDSLTPTASLGIYGTVSGTVSGSKIHGSLDGHVDYYSPAQPVGGKPQTQCSAPDHAMVFRRR
jgi:hypothetical protein